MTRRLYVAQSGHGKSWKLQHGIEEATEDYDHVIVLDFKDEYRGLVVEKSLPYTHWIVGPIESDWTLEDWREMLQSNQFVVFAKYSLTPEQWREICDKIIQAARQIAGPNTPVVVAIDEAHFVAPQNEKLLDQIKGLATTGRGEGASSMWATQRLAELDETVVSLSDETVVGELDAKSDRKKLDPEYPRDVHSKTATGLQLPPEIQGDGENPNRPVRRYKNDDGETIGSEWIYWDESGDVRRIDTREQTMKSTHYGPEGHTLPEP